jgi:hypothetical protein
VDRVLTEQKLLEKVTDKQNTAALAKQGKDAPL